MSFRIEPRIWNVFWNRTQDLKLDLGPGQLPTWRRSMVIDDARFILIPLRDDRVADGEQREELANVRRDGIVGFQIAQHCRRVADFVHDAAYRRLVVLHHVLGQCARLVRENVLHLAQFLVQVRCACSGRSVRLSMVHLQVVVDERRLVFRPTHQYFHEI